MRDAPAIGRRRDAGAGASATPAPKLKGEVGGLGPAVTGFERLGDGTAALAGDPAGPFTGSCQCAAATLAGDAGSVRTGRSRVQSLRVQRRPGLPI